MKTKKKQVLIVGATGMVGGCALRICLRHPDIDRITVIGRHSTGIEHEKLQEIIHQNYTDYSAIQESLRSHGLVLFCLGVYGGTVRDDIFRKITVDYSVAFAKAFYKENPDATFCFLSGQGADQREKSRLAFARYKGAAENALLSIGFPRVAIFRPGYIYPVTPRREPNRTYRLLRKLYPIARYIYPNIGISSEDLALAMVKVGQNESLWTQSPILENKDIRMLVNQG